MSHRINLTINWIHAKLEYITGSILGASTFVLDVPQVLLKIVIAIILGAAGACGSFLFKLLIAKLKKK
jgi:hypothetical protein